MMNHDALTRALAEARAEIERLTRERDTFYEKFGAEVRAHLAVRRMLTEKSARAAAEAEAARLREALEDHACGCKRQCVDCAVAEATGVVDNGWKARAALAKTEGAKPRPRIVSVPSASRIRCRAWKAYCPERPELGSRYAATEAKAMAAMAAALAEAAPTRKEGGE